MNNSLHSFFVSQKCTALKADRASAVSSKSAFLSSPKSFTNFKKRAFKSHVFFTNFEGEEESKEKAPICSVMPFASDADLFLTYSTIENCFLSPKINFGVAAAFKHKNSDFQISSKVTAQAFQVFPYILGSFKKAFSVNSSNVSPSAQLDVFPLYFITQLSYASEIQLFPRFLRSQVFAQPFQFSIVFFKRHSPFFTTSSGSQSFSISSKYTRTGYALVVSSFFQTALFFSGNTSAFEFFNGLFSKNRKNISVKRLGESNKSNTLTTSAGSSLRKRSTRLLSSKYARRVFRENLNKGKLPVVKENDSLIFKTSSIFNRLNKGKANKKIFLPFFSRCAYIHTKRPFVKKQLYRFWTKRFNTKFTQVSDQLQSYTKNPKIKSYGSRTVQSVRKYVSTRWRGPIAAGTFSTTGLGSFRRPLRQSVKSALRGVHHTKVTNLTPLQVNRLDTNLLSKKKISSTYLRTLYFKLYPSRSQEAYLNPNAFTQVKYLLSVRANSRFSFYPINALSLVRFAYNHERHVEKAKYLALRRQSDSSKKKAYENVKLSLRFLSKLEREMTSRFRYVAIFIKDLIRITFLSVYLKKVNFLASFYAFTLSKLPRNRKETKFLRFLRKLLKVFASQRQERVGVRIRFQGRVNRWRRTKHRIGEKGIISFQSYNTRIDYGRAQAITRKGALGIRIWFAYTPYPFFSKSLKNARFGYASLSSTPKVKTLVSSKKFRTIRR